MCQIDHPIRYGPPGPGTLPHVLTCRSLLPFRRDRWLGLFGLIIALLLTSLSVPATAGTSGTWTNATSGGLWSDPTNWSGGVIADGVGATADFSTLDLTGDDTVTLDGNRTVGTLLFGDTTASNNWTLSGPGGLTLASASTPLIQVNNQAATIATAIIGTQGVIEKGSGTLTLSASNALAGTTTIFGHVQVGNTNALQNGTVALNGGVSALAFSPGIGTFTLGALLGRKEYRPRRHQRPANHA